MEKGNVKPHWQRPWSPLQRSDGSKQMCKVRKSYKKHRFSIEEDNRREHGEEEKLWRFSEDSYRKLVFIFKKQHTKKSRRIICFRFDQDFNEAFKMLKSSKKTCYIFPYLHSLRLGIFSFTVFLSVSLSLLLIFRLFSNLLYNYYLLLSLHISFLFPLVFILCFTPEIFKNNFYLSLTSNF